MNLTTIKSAFGTKLVAGLVAVVMTVPAFVGFAHTANAATDVEGLCALAKSLGISSAQFSAVCGGGSTVTVTSTPATTSSAGRTEYTYHPSIAFMFDRNLNIGDTGNDVKVLQQILNSDPATAIAAGPGSKGQESTYYGQKTRAAVAKWQAKYGITPALGNFYTLTREKMNTTRFIPATVVTTTRPATNNNVSTNDRNDRNDRPSSNGGGDGDIDVSETNSADDGILSPGMTRFLALSFDVSATSDATINGITIKYDGRPDEDDIIENVVLADSDGNILAEDEDFDSDSEAEFNNLDLDIDRGDDMEIFVYVNAVEGIGINNDEFDGNSDGQDFEISVIAIDADGDVDGLPLTGPEHEVEDDDLGKVKVDIDNEGNKIEIGEENELFATIEIESQTADTDDVVYIKSLRLENTGSGDLEEIDDLVAELDNKTYEGTVDPQDDDFVIFHFGKDGYELEEGDNEDIEIRGTIRDDAGDNFFFDVDDSETYNIHVQHEDGYGMPIEIASDRGSVSEVSAADLTFATSDDDESDEVSVGDDIFLGEFEVDIDGEGVDIDELTLEVKLTNGAITSGGNEDDLLLEDVYIENEDGDRVTQTEDAEWKGTAPTEAAADAGTATGTQEIEFDNVELEEGDDVTYKVYATIDDNVATGTEYQVVIKSATGVEGSDSKEDVTASGLGSGLELEERDVEGGDLEYSISRSPASRTIGDDEDAITFARFEFDTSASGEAIDLESFEAVLTVGTTASAAHSASDQEDAVERLKNCQLFDEDKNEVELDNDVDGNDGKGSNPFTFDFDFKKDLELDSDSVTELELRCDIGSLSDGFTFQWSINNALDVRAEGQETNNNVDVDISSATRGGLMTIGSSRLDVKEDASSPSTRLVVEGTEVILGVLELEANDGEVVVEDINLSITTTGQTDSNQLSEILEGQRVYAYLASDLKKDKDARAVGYASFTSSNVDIIENIDVRIEDDEKVEVVFKATISSIGDQEDADNGDSLRLTVESVTPEDDDVVVDGVTNGNSNGSTGTIEFDKVVVFETVPSIAEVRFNEENQQLSTGDNEMLQFSIGADDGDDVTIGEITLEVTTQGTTTINSVQVEVSDNKSFNNLVSVNDGRFLAGTPSGDNYSVSFSDASNNYLEIPNDETYYFRVIVDATTANGSNIRVQINEDATQSTATTVAGVTGNLVWTPDLRSSGTEWFNGFEVEGMESNIDNSRDRYNN